MRTLARIITATMVALLVSTMAVSSADARGGHGGRGGHGPRVGIGLWVGPGWWPGWGWPYYYPSYYYPYYPPERTIVIQQPPEAYEQEAPQTEQAIYWYFCKDPQGYYPYVKQCPNGWMKVVPTPPEEPPSEPPE